MDFKDVGGSGLPDLDRADQQSATSCGDGHQSRDTGWSSLSERERQVARLVSEGLTNAGVAQHLFLSRHTVDYHLRRVYMKLDLHSRVRLTRVVSELGDTSR